MSGTPLSPQLVRAGLVLVDPASLAVLRVLSFQYNSDTCTRTLQPQVPRTDGAADQLEALRLKGPPEETIRLEAELDAAEWLEIPDGGGLNDTVARHGLLAQLSAWETIVYPPSAQLRNTHSQAASGIIDLIPPQGPLVLFVWGAERIVPVQITELTVTEEGFDRSLHPIRARITLVLRVLSTDALGFTQPASDLYLRYQERKETLAGLMPSTELRTLGITSIRGG